MRLRQIEDFLTVVESGSIRAAARQLGVSQPAITKSMRRLEADLGSRLVQRTPQGIVLTNSGRVFLARAKVAFSELRRARDEVARTEDPSGGSVAFRVGPTTGVLIVPEAVALFRAQFPLARVRVVESFGRLFIPLVRDGTLDFAVGGQIARMADSALSFQPLFSQELIVAARKGHPLRHAKSLKVLTDLEWITLTPNGSEVSWADRVFTSAGIRPPTHSIQCESYNVFVALLAQTDMVGILSSRALATPFARDSLERIRIQETLPSYTTGLFTRKGTQLTPPAAMLAKMLVQVSKRLTH